MQTSAFQDFKVDMVAVFNLSKDALHVYVGLLVFVAVAILLRRKPRTFLPLLAVFFVACVGELLDARDDFAHLHHWRWRASLHDVLNTCFWPLMLTLLTRLGLLRNGR